MFPVYVLEEDTVLPQEGTFYVVASNGLFIHKQTGILNSVAKVENIPFLREYASSLDLNLPKIPLEISWKIQNFFKNVVHKYSTEATVTLYYNKENRKYRVHVPKQFCSHASVHYEKIAFSHLESMKDFLCVGTIHSHCDFAAFHSGVDVGDELDFDGIHITFGNNDRDVFSISASVVANSDRMLVHACGVMSGVEEVEEGYFKFNSIDEKLKLKWINESKNWIDQVVVSTQHVPQLKFEVFDDILIDQESGVVTNVNSEV